VIVGLTGFAGSGKDTVAKSMKLRGQFNRVAFADPLKNLAMKLDPVCVDPDNSSIFSLRNQVNLYGWEQTKRYEDVRRFLQRLGAGARETFGEDVWIRAASKVVLGYVTDKKNVVLTDVRYPNEVDYVKSLGGFVVRVERPGVGPVNDHDTEVLLKNFDVDYVLTNDQTVDKLGSKVTIMLDELKGRTA